GLYRDHFRASEPAYLAFNHRVCERDFNTFYKLILRLFVTPFSVVDRASKLYSTYVDGGRLAVSDRKESGRPSGFTVKLDDIVTRYDVFAMTTQGFIEQILVMAGAKDLRVQRVSQKHDGGVLSVDY